jgi:hypothetical protein
MISLRRLLKKKTLEPLLSQARTLLGPGWSAVVCDTDENLPASPAAGTCLPLRLDGVCIGYLRLIAPLEGPVTGPGAPEPERIGPFLAGCLEQLLAGEAARRSLANEALLKYSEISLLHRAPRGLHGSLRPGTWPCPC